jgi:hypothetical protein
MKFTTKQLSYEDILQYVSEEDIALFYLGVTSKSKMFSFYREETNPGYYLYYKNGKMMYYDCVESRTLSRLIMEVNDWSFKDFMDNLKQDFSARLITPSKIKKLPKIESKPKNTEIKIKARDWEDWDLEFWGKGGITLDWLKDLRRNIKPLSYFWAKDYLNVAEKYCYSYEYYWHNNVFRRKIYQPYSTNRKWVSNVDTTVIQNISTLPKSPDNELLIISSSYKDTGVIECNLTLPDNRLYVPSCAPNNEGAFLPPQLPYKFSQRFKRILTWFDNDYAGHKAAKKYQQLYGYESIFIPKGWGKDQFEFRDKYGEIEFVKLSNYLLYERSI